MWKLMLLAPIPFTIALCASSEIHTAMQRSRQKETLAKMSRAASQMEKGTSPVNPVDGWGRPMRVHRAGAHYSIRSAGADGAFERDVPARYIVTSKFSADLVLANGVFVQFPEGICAGDHFGSGPLGDCMSCHPRHVRKR